MDYVEYSDWDYFDAVVDQSEATLDADDLPDEVICQLEIEADFAMADVERDTKHMSTKRP